MEDRLTDLCCEVVKLRREYPQEQAINRLAGYVTSLLEAEFRDERDLILEQQVINDMYTSLDDPDDREGWIN